MHESYFILNGTVVEPKTKQNIPWKNLYFSQKFFVYISDLINPANFVNLTAK